MTNLHACTWGSGFRETVRTTTSTCGVFPSGRAYLQDFTAPKFNMTVCSCCWLVPAGRPRRNTVRCVCPLPGWSAGAAEGEAFAKPLPAFAAAFCATLVCCADASACPFTGRAVADVAIGGGRPAAAATPGFDCTSVSSTPSCIARSSGPPNAGGASSSECCSMSISSSASTWSSTESGICSCNVHQHE